MNAREATQAKLQELLSRVPPLPGRGLIIYPNNDSSSNNNSVGTLNDHVDMYQYITMNRDESTSQRLTDQFKILKPPPKMNQVSAEVMYARKTNIYSNNNRKQSNQDDETNENFDNTRPASASKVTGLSWHLQLDQDKYVDRRRSFDSAEKASKEKQEAYEEYLHQRLQRASHGSHRAFLDLVKRNEEWKRQCHDKQKRSKEQVEEEWTHRRKEFRKKLTEHINKTLPKPDPNLQEIEVKEVDRQGREQVERCRYIYGSSQSRPPNRTRSRGKIRLLFKLL